MDVSSVPRKVDILTVFCWEDLLSITMVFIFC
jgi:hypothetical protein